MKHENYKTLTDKYHAKTHNEDWAGDLATVKGHLFFVIDFANFSYTTLTLTLQRTLEEIVPELDKLPGLSVDSFLGHVAKELNNFVYTFGRDNCDGKLFCVAAIALLHGNKLYYLTYGDSRINILTDDRLLLLNGAKYQTRSIISDTKDTPPQIRENPEQMGRSLFDIPLTDRVRSFALGDRDVILMFSDGLEENVTPQRRLSELRTIGKLDPKAICEAMLKISEPMDDRTITVITGPYKPLGESAFEEITKRLVGVENTCKRQSDITNQLNTAVGSLQSNYLPRSEVADLTKQLNSESSASKVASLEERMDRLEAKNGKGKGRPAEGPLVFTLDQAAYDTIRDIVNAKPVNDVKETGTANSSEAKTPTQKKVVHGKAEPDRGFLQVLGNPTVVMLSIFLFGMLALWLLQVFSNKMWPERWLARTEGDSLIVERNDYLSVGPTFTVKLQPPVPNTRQEASSFEELAPVIAKLQEGARPAAVAPTPVRNDNSTVPAETVQSVAIQRGDSLSRLATKYNTTEAKLRELNPTVNWNKIAEGQLIQVPIANVNPGNAQK